MRIAYIIEGISQRGGQERILFDKMNYLAEHTDDDVYLITVWRDTSPLVFPLHEGVKMVNLNVPILPLPFGYSISLLLALFKFNTYINKIDPDVAVFCRAIGAFFSSLTTWKGKKIFESHTIYKASNHTWLYPFMQRRMNCIVCLTMGDAREFKYAKRVEVIPNFTNIEYNRVIDYSKKNIVFVGRDCPEKDIPRLRRLWEKVQLSHQDWTLSIHTDTKDILQAYLEGSILVMTSKAEGFGLVLIEAMSCGLTCVAFDCPYGPREVIENGKNGYLVPYDDDKAFIEKLSLLMDNESLRRQMGETAKVTAQRFRPAPIMEKWKKLFNSLLH